ncbi:MAG TPA: flippase-like domain-containing protein, partial [Acidimicrobiales bacterium]|nr:flippase-like domain-containing protein [Acidimicrobiales bacterium]
GVWLSVCLLVLLTAAVIVATRDRVLGRVARAAQRVVDVVGRGRGPRDIVDQAFTQRSLLHTTVRRHWGRAGAAAFGQAFAGYLALYVTLVAAGVRPNVVVVLAAFAVANVAGMIPVTPAGLGFVEAGLAAVLVMGGVTEPVAVVVAIAYRVVSSWLPAAAGGIAFIGARRSRTARHRLVLADQPVDALRGLAPHAAHPKPAAVPEVAELALGLASRSLDAAPALAGSALRPTG